MEVRRAHTYPLTLPILMLAPRGARLAGEGVRALAARCVQRSQPRAAAIAGARPARHQAAPRAQAHGNFVTSAAAHAARLAYVALGAYLGLVSALLWTAVTTPGEVLNGALARGRRQKRRGAQRPGVLLPWYAVITMCAPTPPPLREYSNAPARLLAPRPAPLARGCRLPSIARRPARRQGDGRRGQGLPGRGAAPNARPRGGRGRARQQGRGKGGRWRRRQEEGALIPAAACVAAMGWQAPP